MEVYIPYIVGSSVSALIGKYAYNYLYSDNDGVVDSLAESKSKSKSIAKETTQKAINSAIDYNLLDATLNETKVNSDISNNSKIQKLKRILQNECNRTIHSDLKKKNVRRKWINIISEYETIGHNSFVTKWSKQ